MSFKSTRSIGWASCECRVRQDGAEQKPGPVKDEEGTPSTASQMRALAAQADAEAAESEALAAAARARARALEFRRQAELLEADAAQTKGPAEGEVKGTQPQSEQQDIPTETGPTEEVVDDRVAEEGADVRSDVASDVVAEKPRWYRRWRRRPRLATLAASLVVIIIVASLAASTYVVVEHRNARQQRPGVMARVRCRSA